MPVALSGNNTNVTCTTTATITAEPAGNTLVLWVASFRSGAARTVSSISTTNVTWTKLVGTTNGTMDAEIWVGVVAGGSSGTAVTLTMSGTGSTTIGRITGFSGVSLVGADGVGATNTGTSTSPTTGAYSISMAGSLALTVEGHANGTTPSANPGSPWTTITFNNSGATVGVAGGYQLSASAGAQSAAWTIGNLAWVTGLGGLRSKEATKSVTDTITLSEDRPKVGVSKPMAAETITLAESRSAGYVAKVKVDTLTLSDSITQRSLMKLLRDAVDLFEPTFLRELYHAQSSAAISLTDSLNTSSGSGTSFTKDVSDSFNLSDLLAKGPAKSLQDAVVISDTVSALLVLYRTLVDTIDVTDTLSKASSKVLSDLITLVDSMTRTWEAVRSYVDTITPSDTISKATSKSLANTIVPSDSLTKGIEKANLDSIDVSDLFSRTWVVVRSLQDTLTLSESVAKSIGKSVLDNINVTDAFSRAWAAFRTFADSIDATDSVSKGCAKSLPETLPISDSYSRALESLRTFTDNVDVVETLSKGPSKYSFDSLTLLDAFSKRLDAVRTFVDILDILDSFEYLKSGQGAVTFNETITLGEAFIKGPSKGLPDLLDLQEYRNTGVSRPMFEEFLVGDALYKAIATSKLDSLTLDDVYSRILDSRRTFQDSLSIEEALTKGIVKGAIDLFAIAELLNAARNSGNSLSFLETEILLSDSMGIRRSFFAQPIDSIDISDTKRFDLRRRLLDTIVLLDVFRTRAPILRRPRGTMVSASPRGVMASIKPTGGME